ncbi:MAG: U32 family peptidase [Clostridiales bacterium]|nr:U32 family peptidase [Clostridiales bacterium]
MELELLSPAGDFEKLKTALYFGADAVYLGGPFMHLRAAPTEFTMENLKTAIDYAHVLGKKVYVTVNAFARNSDFEALPEYLRNLHSISADGIIVSDLGVIALAAETVPELPVHVSTQASCVNYVSANTYYKMGAKRIVLGREMSLDEIKELRDKTPPELELEAFVHGAMCMAYSGRCLISAFLAGRDSNRGDCAQPCRWRYNLVEESRPDEVMPVFEDEQGTTIMSSRDLKTIDFLDKIIDAGVTSFKIEGRMKSPYYVATVTNAYRKAVDHSAPLELLEDEIRSASHREFSTGFYFGKIKHEPPAPDGYKQNAQFSAVVLGSDGERVKIEQRNRFFLGDTLEVLSPNSTGEKLRVEEMWDEEGNAVEAAPHPQQKLYIKSSLNLQAGDILRKRA